MNKVIRGFNDLKTIFPDIASEAYGWDPSEYISGSGATKSWKCKLGHTWNTRISHRTKDKTSCPFCTNRKVWSGFNDLKTKFPEIAAEANGWDPTKYLSGSHTKLNWKCKLGHTWDAAIKNRTLNNSGCIYCVNYKVLKGFNDLATKCPDIAKEADGWDASEFLYRSTKKKSWKCKLGHSWEACISDRTRNKSRCPICANKKNLKGFNDLKTKFPEIAAEADGWDPSQELFGSFKKKSWKCKLGHTWETTIIGRTQSLTQCPICKNRKIYKGSNDLKTKFPEIAAEANGWDPSEYVAGSHVKLNWKCKLGHTWDAFINERCRGNTSCPFCSNHKIWVGFNDLKTKFPEIAAEADGWDPSEYIAGSGVSKSWKCKLGHSWNTRISHRTSQNTGCPTCANRKLLVGFNDLKTKFPEIAAEADGWDPSKYFPGNNKKFKWKCKLGHSWTAAMNDRTRRNNGCPICSNQELLIGFNDLKTRFPDVAKEAHGWDPSKIMPGNNSKKRWKCKLGHSWEAVVNSRTTKGKETNCPICANQQLLIGFNDLKTRFPDIAKEAHGWDPSKIMPGSKEKNAWKCNIGHIYYAPVHNRTSKKTNCSYCSNRLVLSGFNDLKTKYPEIAKEANGWDPTKVIFSSHKVVAWKCEKGHAWNTRVSHRTEDKTGCPSCAEFGFNPEKPSWFYLMKRFNSEHQLGISNVIEQRIKVHELEGWETIEITGPHDGYKVYETEKQLKEWLRKKIGLIEGTHENWYQSRLKVHSLKELKEKSGIKTNIF